MLKTEDLEYDGGRFGASLRGEGGGGGGVRGRTMRVEYLVVETTRVVKTIQRQRII